MATSKPGCARTTTGLYSKTPWLDFEGAVLYVTSDTETRKSDADNKNTTVARYRVEDVEEKFLSLDPISSAMVRRVVYYLTSGKMKGRRKCWKIKMKKRRKVKMTKKARKSERTLNSCMRHGDDNGME